MKFGAVAVFFLSTAAAWVVPPPSTVAAVDFEAEIPPCGVDAPHPCSCPKGTSYLYIQTYFSWGANAWSVRNLTGNCKYAGDGRMLLLTRIISLRFELGAPEDQEDYRP